VNTTLATSQRGIIKSTTNVGGASHCPKVTHGSFLDRRLTMCKFPGNPTFAWKVLVRTVGLLFPVTAQQHFNRICCRRTSVSRTSKASFSTWSTWRSAAAPNVMIIVPRAAGSVADLGCPNVEQQSNLKVSGSYQTPPVHAKSWSTHNKLHLLWGKTMIGLGFGAQLRFPFVCSPLPFFLGFGVFYCAPHLCSCVLAVQLFVTTWWLAIY